MNVIHRVLFYPNHNKNYRVWSITISCVFSCKPLYIQMVLFRSLSLHPLFSKAKKLNMPKRIPSFHGLSGRINTFDSIGEFLFLSLAPIVVFYTSALQNI